jgi:hypothetical protein
VARDLMPLGYSCVLFEKDAKGGGLMRTNIPSFRLPAGVLDEEIDRIVAFGVEARFGEEIKSLDALLREGFDAVFIGTGAPRARTSTSPVAKEACGQHPHRYRLAYLGRLRARAHRRQARGRDRRRQHRHGLLPHGAAPWWHGREGDGTLAAAA